MAGFPFVHKATWLRALLTCMMLQNSVSI